MPSRRTIRHLRWWIIGLVMLGTSVNYLARSSLGAAAPTLSKDMSLTTQAKVPHRWEYRHDAVGYNYRLPNLNAALGTSPSDGLKDSR